MFKFLLLSLCLISVTINLNAQWYRWGEKYCWGARQYMDPTYANYDYIMYGYQDNINYPNRYDFPLNHYFEYYFNCSLHCRDSQYLKNCILLSRKNCPQNRQ
jgi:hypothetical protein